ncbi:aldo/keto reductase [Hungatella effluvii]|uniref:aldo/keto reductase n=1 Tax=Hungatella effluvii TaxID=1096246 RepID=UPI002FDB5E91
MDRGSWDLRDPAVTSVLIGASRPEQILENLETLKHVEFTPEELAEIEFVVQREEM